MKIKKIALISIVTSVLLLNLLQLLPGIENSGLNVKELLQKAYADSEGGTVKEHAQVVGCGSRAFEDWKSGCCEGTGGCTDNCDKTPEYCD